jgi:HAD superfamily hydrolase (TIGR01509 family)
MIRSIFWDNDGVLVDTEKFYFQATCDILQGIGITLTPELFNRISLVEGQSAFVLAQGKGISPEELARLHEVRNRRYTQLLAESDIPVLDGVKAALGELRGTVAMAIVTSSRRVHFDTMHAKTGLLPYFDFVLVREDYGYSKPDPEPYLTAMKKSGCAPDECVVVEDSPRGVASAFSAGIRCLVVPNDLTRGNDFPGAWRIIDNCGQVPEEIRRLNGHPFR